MKKDKITDQKCYYDVKKLFDLATPKKLVRHPSSEREWFCPTCLSGQGEYEGTVGTHNYCHYCGQHLDWSKENE